MQSTDISSCLIMYMQQGDVGMKDPLVDNEGYPRSDIDVYAVRTARNRIISKIHIFNSDTLCCWGNQGKLYSITVV